MVQQSSLCQLIGEIRKEASREPFPLDKETYDEAGLDVLEPIVHAGNLDSGLCFFARDLGRDEVHARQPLYGAAGRIVRKGIYQALFQEEHSQDVELERVLDKVLLTNTVPYKPPGNKAYSQKIKNRFRPFIETFLVGLWRGSWIIPLGTEALEWFLPFDPNVAEFASNSQRFEMTLKVMLKATVDAKQVSKQVTLAPLPHPSPLNQKYYSIFPQMLQLRLKQYMDGK